MDYVRSPSYKRDSTYTKAFLWTTLALTYGQLGIGAYSIWHYATWQIRDSDTMYAQTKADCLTTFFVGSFNSFFCVSISMCSSACRLRSGSRAVLPLAKGRPSDS